ncbi:hypothetical protein [Erwinia sp. S43]|uniref:hypothetical protein n=1 Tax=Erwinia sp. S43 TaxID=2769339 RepID=UPI001F22CF00|nr:hypothetical protein [Erwinia sp. S43]
MQNDDTLDVRTPDGDELKNNAHEFSDEVRALMGQIITELLSDGDAVTPERLIQGLHLFSENTDDADDYLDCMELIQFLMKKLH